MVLSPRAMSPRIGKQHLGLVLGGICTGILTTLSTFLLSFSRSNIFFNITSPIPGTFIIALHYKGRDKAILEMDLKLDDLLEKVK